MRPLLHQSGDHSAQRQQRLVDVSRLASSLVHRTRTPDVLTSGEIHLEGGQVYTVLLKVTFAGDVLRDLTQVCSLSSLQICQMKHHSQLIISAWWCQETGVLACRYWFKVKVGNLSEGLLPDWVCRSSPAPLRPEWSPSCGWWPRTRSGSDYTHTRTQEGKQQQQQR